MERIVIAVACDNNYAPYAGVLITSIFENNKKSQVEVNVLTDFISEDNIILLHQLECIYSQKINIIEIDKEQFSHLPLDNRTAHINICAYYRLLIPDLFSKEDKVLYLDVDMIVRKDLRDLWNTDLTGYAFAAVKDTWQMQGLCNHLKYSPEEFYYCSGMLLFNVKYLRGAGFDRIIHDFIENNFDLIICHDQDILNGSFHGHFKPVSTTWNMLGTFLEKKYEYGYYDRNVFLKCRLDPAIVHYTGPLKPWYKDSLHPYRRDFLKYHKISPWNLRFTYKLKFSDRVKMYLKFYCKQFLGKCGFNYGIVTQKINNQ